MKVSGLISMVSLKLISQQLAAMCTHNFAALVCCEEVDQIRAILSELGADLVGDSNEELEHAQPLENVCAYY